ncbi:hypothetical protein [Salinarimonas rosea]|uniref:hypothetical protein n=1 Tax=Salinarimonas rosea TaxID=552063 RepID=UPI000428B724|nr:hypothetical protein [Salinarimonas rosea]
MNRPASIVALAAALASAPASAEPAYEIVLYRVPDPATADAERARAEQHVRALPGFVGWTTLIDTSDPTRRVDIVVWRSLPEAQAAGRQVQSDPRFAAFMASIGAVDGFGHFREAATAE